MRSWTLAPARLLLGAFFAAPLAITVAYSFLTRGTYGGQSAPVTGASYARLFDPLYLSVYAKTFWIAGLSTVTCLVLGFPLALFIARSGRRKNLYLHLVMLPFWTSFLVRTYAWMFLLRDTGLVNSALLAAGWIREPLPLLYNDFAVVAGLVYGYLPFAVLPLYATLERMDRSLLEAAADLGSRPWDTLWRVLLPMSRPGVTAAAMLVFIPCLGTYLTSDLLGGGRSILLGNVIQNQFTSARDWPFGSALAVILMTATTLFLSRRREPS